MMHVLFLELIKELSDRFNIEVYAYVLMGNHYYLLLKTRKRQWFETACTGKFNLLNKRNGHLFQGRFKSISNIKKRIRKMQEVES